MDDETIQFRNDFLDDLCDSSRRIKNPVLRRQATTTTRQAASHVDFHVSNAPADIERIPKNEILRIKHRQKCQHCCNSCHCQQNDENFTYDTIRKNENCGRKNSEKPEATSSQRLDNGKNMNFPMKSRRVGSSPQQRNQNHRPGTSTSHCQNRNNNNNNPSSSSGVNRHSKKYDNCPRHECSRHDSPLREIVNSDGATEEMDYRRLYEQMHSRNEPHSEPEIDLSPMNRRYDYNDTKKRHSGQGESIINDNNYLDDDRNKPSIETGSSVAKDDWQQYERDKRELEELDEDLREYVKRKLSSGQIDEEKKNKRDDLLSRDTYEKINLFVSKLPVPRGKNSVTRTMSKSRIKCAKSPKERTRIRSSKNDARKTHRSSRIDDRLGESKLEERELERKPDDKLLVIQQLESSKLDEEDEEERENREEEEDEEEEEEAEDTEEEIQVKEDETGSETEKEARQLLKEETELERMKRRLKKSWSECRRDESRNSRDTRRFKREKKIEKLTCRKRDKYPRESCTLKRERTKISRENIDIPCNPGKQNYYDNTIDRTDECDNVIESREKLIFHKNKKNTRDENFVREETREKLYERANSVLDGTRKNFNVTSGDGCGNGDIEPEKSKTRTCIDEMIDDGLSREAKRENSGTLPGIKKADFPYDMNETKRVSLRYSGNTEEPSKIIRDECFCHTLTRRREIFPITERTNDERAIIDRDDCYCRGIVKILANHSTPRDYVRKLKNRRRYYLDNIQSNLGKMYDLERILDSFSPERKTEIVRTEINDDLTRESRKSLEKREMMERFAGES